MDVVVVVVASLLHLLQGVGGVGADSPSQPVHGVRQGRQQSSVSSHVGLCEALQYPCLIGTVLPHPTDCQLYLQCVFPGVGQIGVSNNWIVRACSQGTMFDRGQLFCVLPSGVECAQKCENNGTIPGLPGREGSQDTKVKQIPPTQPQEKGLEEQGLPEGRRQGERPSIPLSETLYLPEKLKSELPPQDYNAMSNSQGTAQGGRAAQGEKPHSGYRSEGQYPAYRSTDHSQESRGPREANLGQGQQHREGQYPPHRPSDQLRDSGAREALGERIEPRKGRFPEYRPSDFQTDDHKGAWGEGIYPEYVPRTESHSLSPAGRPEALTDRHKSGGGQGGHYAEHRMNGDSPDSPPKTMSGGNQQGGFNTDMFKPRASRDAQQRPSDGNSPNGKHGAVHSTQVRGVDAKQAPDNQGGTPEQFWWDALNLLYSQEAKGNSGTGGAGSRQREDTAPEQTEDAGKSRNWRRKDQTATNWNNNKESSPSRNRNRKEPIARNQEPPRDRTGPQFRNLNGEKPPMRNFNNKEDLALRGQNRENPSLRNVNRQDPVLRGQNSENPPIRKWDRVDPPWRTREIRPVFPAPTPVAPLQQQQQSQFPVRLSIPTPLPIPEPSTLVAGDQAKAAAATPGTSGRRDAWGSSRFPMGYRSKTRDVTKSAKPQKTEYNQRKTPTTRSVFGDHVTRPGATTEAPSTIMPWGMFYKLLRKYALGSDATPGSDIGSAMIDRSQRGPTTQAMATEQRDGKASKAGIPESKGRDSGSPGRVTSPRTPYLGAKMGRNYRLGHSSAESRTKEQGEDPYDNRGKVFRQRNSNNRNAQSRQGHWEKPTHSATNVGPSRTEAEKSKFTPNRNQSNRKSSALPKGEATDARNIGGKSMLVVPRPAPPIRTNPSKVHSAVSLEQSSEYSIEEPPSGEAGNRGGELLRSIEAMFPDLDLSDLDPEELERFLNRQISSAEMVDTDIDTTDSIDTTDTTSTTERSASTKGSDTTAATIAPTPTGTTLATSKANLQKPTPDTSKPNTKSSSEQPELSSSEQLRTVRIPLSSLTEQLLQQEFTDKSSQSSAAEAASRVRTLYRYLQRRLRLQGYRPVLKIAEVQVTTASATTRTDGMIPATKGTTTGFSEQDLWESLKEKTQKVTTARPTSATLPITTKTTTTQSAPTQATSRPTTTQHADTTKSEPTQSKAKHTKLTEELVEPVRHEKEPWYKDAKDVSAHGIKEDGLKQAEVEHSFNRGTLLSEEAPVTSVTTEGINVEYKNTHHTTHPTPNINPSTKLNANDETEKSPELFEANPEVDLPGERDGTDVKDPRDKDVFHLPHTTVSQRDDTQGVTVEYGHVAMPAIHEGDSRSLEMVYSVSKEESGANSHQHSNQTSHKDGDSPSTSKVPTGNPHIKASQSHERDSPFARDSQSDIDSQSERDSPVERDSQSERDFLDEREFPSGWDSLTSTTEASPGGGSLKALIIPGAMPPPGGWRKVEHKMLLGMEGMREGLGEGLNEGLGEGIGGNLHEGLGEGLGEGMRENLDEGLGKGMKENRDEGLGTGLGEGLGMGLGEEIRENLDEGLDKGTREILDEGAGEGVGKGTKENLGEGMSDSHLYEHIHPEVAPSYERVDGVNYDSGSVEKVNPTVTATMTTTDADTHSAVSGSSKPGADVESAGGDNRGGYQPSVIDRGGHTSTLPLSTPTTAPILTMDFGTYHQNTNNPVDNTGKSTPADVRVGPYPSTKDTAVGPTKPGTQPTRDKIASGIRDRNDEVTKSSGSPKISVPHLLRSTTTTTTTTRTKMDSTSLGVPTSHEDRPLAVPTPRQGVNKTLSVVHVDTHHHINVTRPGVEGVTTDSTTGTTTSVTMKSEGVSVGLIVGISFVVLLLIAIAMLPLIFCAIYKKDRKRINDNYMDRSDISTLASYGTNNRNYTSTTTLASVGSTRPLIRTPSWINKMMLFKRLNRKSVSDHCLVNMYHERQHPSTEDLYGSHGNQSCHLATKYASLSTEKATSRKKRKSRESSSRMDDVISDFADESVFYLKRPKVKTKPFTPSVV